MWPVLGGLITGGASLLGSIFSNQTAAQNSQIAANTSQMNNQQQIEAQKEMLGQTEQFNAQEAEKTRSFQNSQVQQQEVFQQQMSGTAYQRASADMKAAGLNPAMMFGSGSAASTPTGGAGSGATASVGTPTVPQAQFAPPQKANALAGLGDAVGKAFSSAVQTQTIDKMAQEMANMKAQVNLTEAQTKSEAKRPELIVAQSDLTRADYRKRISEGTREEALVPKSVFEGTVAKDLLTMPEWLRRSAVIGGFTGNKISEMIAPVISSAGAVSRFMGR